VWETTSGLPDDSREENDRTEERRLRELRARVKLARAVVANTPGLAETLARDWGKAARAVVATTPGLAETLADEWQKAARFFVRFGITEGQFRNGVPALGRDPGSDEFDVAFRLASLPATLKGTVFIPDEWSASPHPRD
jgi:hypothetical protein